MNQGIHKISMEDYLDMKAVSSGLCHRIVTQSPFHARLDSPWNDARIRENHKTADIGSAAHKILLEGTENGITVIDADDWRTKAAKELRDSAYAEGAIPMLIGKMDAVRAMVNAAREYIARSEIAGLFDSGEAEQTLIWNEGDTLCKARADWLTADRRICLSYKTTEGSANPDSWIRTQLPQYDMATVFYERGVLAACEVDETCVVHLVQEQQYPFACSLIGLDPAYHDLASRRLDHALALWAQCVGTGKWPAYPGRICWAQPKAWQVGEAEEQASNTALSNDELSGGIPL